MTTTHTGSPPTNDAAPAFARATAIHSHHADTDESSDYVAAMKRRRAASRHLTIQDSGRSDPWHYDEVPLTEHQIEGWQRTVAHLRRAGFCPVVPAAVGAVLR